ncbi:high mobility group box 3 [Ranunculus cassubicifolius]
MKVKGPVNKDKKQALKPVENKVGKRKAATKVGKGSKKPATKGNPEMKGKPSQNDPDKPKRPASAFFVFLEEFRKTYKLEHPKNKAVSAVGKAGGEKWKSLTPAEKAPYEAKAAKRKADYEKLMTSYNKKQESLDKEDEEESEKSISEVSGEDDENTGEEADEDDDE